MTKDIKDVKETKLKDKSARVKRRRLQQSGPLFIDPDQLDSDFHYRIVNDSAYQINKRKKMGYEVVQDSNVDIGDGGASSTNGLGSVPSVVVDKTTGQRGILMRIHKDERAEILEELNEINDDIDMNVKEDALSRAGVSGNIYGKISKE